MKLFWSLPDDNDSTIFCCFDKFWKGYSVLEGKFNDRDAVVNFQMYTSERVFLADMQIPLVVQGL